MTFRIGLGLALFALVAACSASTTTDPSPSGDDSSGSESDLKKKKNTCTSQGGTCVGLSPSSCGGGYFADAKTHSCGGGLGVGCCVECPELIPPPPGFCPDGTVTAKKDAHGCTTGFDCKPLPSKNACESAGGTCVGLSPSSCGGGYFADAKTHSCGGGLGVGCCVLCPELIPPPPGFCPGGTITADKDENGCTVGFECTAPGKTACEAAGGSCVGLTPSACPAGKWGDASKYSCGGGVGVGCCLP